ncbi:sensor histidine kinase [Clostridium thailandense]|uniref:sensor histidine kinase n=1 Tax=Clostridium thailandense TaxID=2794346 RepID=UPI00398A405B
MKFKNRWKIKSLRWKLLIRLFLLLILLLLIMETSQYVILSHYLSRGKEQLLESRIHNTDPNKLLELHSEEDLKNSAREIIKRSIDMEIGISIIDKDGEVIEQGIKSRDNALIPYLSKEDYKRKLNEKGNLEGFIIVKDMNDNDTIVIFRKIGDEQSPIGLIQASTSMEPIESILHRQLYIYLFASILILIIGSLLGRTVLNYTLKPLYNVTNAVEEVTVGQLDMRLPVNSGQLEIDKLSIAFNNMLSHIEESFEKEQYITEKMRQFISDASHELRTPLTSIHGFVEVLLRGAAKDEKKLNLALNTILMESERLSTLVNNLLLLTRLDKKNSVKMKTENIGDIIKEIHPQLNIIAGKRKIQLHIKDELSILVNKDQIKQVIFNLVQNSIMHTDAENGVIDILVNKIAEEGFLGVIEVADNGVGISEDNLNKIFDRFFRIESHRSREQGGYGLGLAIVKSIVDGHNGKIKVTSKLGKGTTFYIYFK